jgi:hypothetical protein
VYTRQMAGRDTYRGEWFPALLEKVAGRREEVAADGTPPEMIRKVSWRAFQISTAAASVPGLASFAAILPEIAALTKIQIDLIYKIAAYHNKHEKIDLTLILLIFGNVMGVALGHGVMMRVEERLLIRSLDSAIARKVARKIGSRIVAGTIRKGMRALIPFVAAPLFGYFSKKMTRRIGEEADKIFSRELEVEQSAPLP